jgi:hypothetical protein
MQYKRIKKTKKIWDYMRRNRVFCVADVLILFDARESYLREVLMPMQKCGYLVVCRDGVKFREREYRLVRDTGVHPPTARAGGLYDKNLRAEVKYEEKE